MIVVFCHHCGTELTFSDRVGLRAECDKCGGDAHVCKNCQFYDPKVYNECREPQAEVVMEKDRANRCEFFQPAGKRGETGIDAATKAKNDMRAAAEALFKKKS